MSRDFVGISILQRLAGRARRRGAPKEHVEAGAGEGLRSASLKPKKRTIIVDHEWVENLHDANLTDHVFQRVSAKKIRFANVNFKYCTFDSCYLRECVFDSCDFTGCRFVGSNFHRSTFSDCRFDYAAFERTLIESDILDSCSPQHENLKQRFARTLRTNYQALGDSEAVNKAILVELAATRVHLNKTWRSSEAYYRQKYAGLERVLAFLRWSQFVVMDALWGNGERASRLVRTSIALLILVAAVDTFVRRTPTSVADWWSAMVDALQALIGTGTPPYSGPILAILALARYVLLGLFVSILVRRLARR